MFDGLLEPTHLIIILVIVLIIFGPGKLPELGSALGRGIKEFRGGMQEAAEPPAPTAQATMSPATVVSPGPATPTVAESAAPTVASAPEPVAATVCPTCGAAVPSGARFCGQCGTPTPQS